MRTYDTINKISGILENIFSSMSIDMSVDMSSFRLFRVAICGLDNMKNFSVIHKLQRLVVLEYALAFAMIFHEIE